MSERLKVLITGGTRGIGLGIARCLARAGCDLALCGRRAQADVADALAGLRGLGARVRYCRADVADARDRRNMLADLRGAWGALNVLVNNAGMAPRVRADILDAGEESFDEVLAVNLKGPYFLTQAVARDMIAAGRDDPGFRACIVNVSSVSAVAASTSRGEYCISKAGLSMATRLWAARLGEYGIPVYEVRPGITRTDMTAEVKEKYDRLLAQGLCVQPRWGEPEDVGRVVAAMVRGDLAYSTGQVVNVDGGMLLRRL